MSTKRGRPGNPNWRKGGPSPNPTGRPRSARIDALEREQIRADGWVNRALAHGTSRDARVFTEHQLVPVVDLEALRLTRGDDNLGRVAEAKPFDAWRRGVKIRVSDDAKKLGDQMVHAMDAMSVAQKFRDAGVMERALGGAAILPIFDGEFGSLADPMPDEPSLGHLKALHVLQPRELVPIDWYADIEDERFRFPKLYSFIPVNVIGAPTKATYVSIHASRLIIFDGVRAVPHHVEGQRIGWGDSVFLRVRQVAADFGLAWGSASTLLAKFAQATYAMDGLHQTLAKAGGTQQVRDRIALMDELASTIRAAVIDGKDKYTREQTPVSGMADLLIQLAQRVAAAAEMPVTRLMGMSPAGLNATGESDMRTWYDTVEVYRRQYEPKLRKLLRWMWLSNDGPSGGVEPDQWSVEWPPLWQPTEKEIAETRLAVAQADKLYAIDIGAVTPGQVARSRFGGDSYSMEMHIDDDEIAAMEQHEQDLQDAQLKEAKNAAEAAKQPPAPAVADPNAPAPGGAPPVPPDEKRPPTPARAGANGTPRPTAQRSDDEIADDISRELASDYPERALEWIHSLKWIGPVRVSTSAIDYADKAQWRASKEPDKVDKFAERIKSGREKPLLLVELPHDPKLDIVDGHHRGLAYEQLGADAPGGGALAYVAKTPTMIGPWTTFHSQQRARAEKQAVRTANAADPDHGWSTGWSHAPAYKPGS